MILKKNLKEQFFLTKIINFRIKLKIILINFYTLLGDSSQPPTNLPNITQSAPDANALHILPLYLF